MKNKDLVNYISRKSIKSRRFYSLIVESLIQNYKESGDLQKALNSWVEFLYNLNCDVAKHEAKEILFKLKEFESDDIASDNNFFELKDYLKNARKEKNI